MTKSTGQRTFLNRAKYRHREPSPLVQVDERIVRECVPIWLESAKRANSRYGGDQRGNHMGRSAALYSVDDELAKHGITFAADPQLWLAYEKRIRYEALAFAKSADV